MTTSDAEPYKHCSQCAVSYWCLVDLPNLRLNGGSQWVPHGKIHDQYRAWCQTNSVQSLSLSRFNKILRSMHCWERRRSTTGVFNVVYLLPVVKAATRTLIAHATQAVEAEATKAQPPEHASIATLRRLLEYARQRGNERVDSFSDLANFFAEYLARQKTTGQN